MQVFPRHPEGDEYYRFGDGGWLLFAEGVPEGKYDSHKGGVEDKSGYGARRCAVPNPPSGGHVPNQKSRIGIDESLPEGQLATSLQQAVAEEEEREETEENQKRQPRCGPRQPQQESR